MIEIAAKLLCEHAVVPSYARPGDAGADLVASARAVVPAHATAVIETGLALAIPDGYVGLVHPRSGLAAKDSVTVLNAPGTIDSGYRGEVKVILINHGTNDFTVEVGMRIAQLVIQRVEVGDFSVVTELPDSSRGTGGFGSTGR